MQADIPYRKLGRTGEQVSAIGLGGWHLGLPKVDRQLSLRIVRTALDRGINFPRQLLGLQQGRQRASHGIGPP